MGFQFFQAFSMVFAPAALALLGLLAIPVGLLVRRLRPVTVALAIQWLVLVRNGYVPFMHAVNLMPWSALLIVAAGSAIAGNSRVVGDGWLRLRRSTGMVRALRAGTAVILAVGLLGAAGVSWTPKLHHAMTVRQQPPLRSATRWVADNVPRDKVLVVHDSIWTDLVQHYGFAPKPVIVYKLDTDPAVRRDTPRVDYLVVPNWYYRTPDASKKYPTLMEARKHAVPVATFGSVDDGVQIYRVSRYWRLP
jgi:hypothetical protein